MPEELLLKNALAIMGDEDVVLGFKALGFKTYVIKEPQTFNLALEEIIGGKFAICLLQDNIYQAYQDLINSYKSASLPVFIPFTKQASTDLLDNIVKGIRLRATGAF